MKARIVMIGNSQGIRIPKPQLLQEQISDEVELEVQANCLVIRPSVQPRDRWSEAFEIMARRGDDELLDGDAVSTTQWDEESWKC